MRTYDNIRKIKVGQQDDYTTGCLLNYPYFKERYKMIKIDLSKQQALDGYPKGLQNITFTGNLGNGDTFFIIEEAKETISDFSQRTVRVL